MLYPHEAQILVTFLPLHDTVYQNSMESIATLGRGTELVRRYLIFISAENMSTRNCFSFGRVS